MTLRSDICTHVARPAVAAFIAAAALVLIPAWAPAADNVGGFDPYGTTDINPCDPDVTGSDAAERLTGGTKPSQAFGTVGLGVLGLGGDDTLVGGAGGGHGDCLRGGSGEDRLYGGPGNDLVNGDSGGDTVSGGTGDDGLQGGDGDDRLLGGDGDDVIDGEAGPDLISGGGGRDWITGGAERNRIDAGPGADTVSSANGIPERVRCGSGRDVLYADRTDRPSGCERVHYIASRHPVVTPRLGSPRAGFRASVIAPFSTSSAAAGAGYLFDVAVRPNGAGCARMTLPSGRSARPGQRVAVTIRSTRRGGFCRGAYRGSVTFASSDAIDNCQSLREANAQRTQDLAECDVRIVLGRFQFRVR